VERTQPGTELASWGHSGQLTVELPQCPPRSRRCAQSPDEPPRHLSAALEKLGGKSLSFRGASDVAECEESRRIPIPHAENPYIFLSLVSGAQASSAAEACQEHETGLLEVFSSSGTLQLTSSCHNILEHVPVHPL
jgi:hypothetical protein